MISQRQLALNILYKVFKENAFANLMMRKSLEVLPPKQRPMVSQLVYGVLRNYDYLLYQAEAYFNGRTRLRLKLIIALALYERFYMQEKAYVINNEYTALAKSSFDKGFVNAVLKNIDTLKSAPKHIEESLPEWLYRLLEKQYSPADFALILNNYKREVQVSYRLNHHKCSYADLVDYPIEILDEDYFSCRDNLINTPMHQAGCFYIQDANSGQLIKPLALKEDDLFLDACSAPGSKLFNALDVVKRAYANDVSATRVELIKKQAQVLGFDNITYSVGDAAKLQFDLQFDKILLDVPCSGLGVISHRPDIKYNISPTSLDELQQLQRAILNNIARYLKRGGLMVYSTCTLNKKENERQIAAFLQDHQDFSCLQQQTIINLQGDCFYYCLLKRL